jgi:hypothetical protein
MQHAWYRGECDIVLIGEPEGKTPVRSSDVDVTIILKWMLEK